ncbi:hypothetical protein CcaCcLH18_12004 [Colletotrichum camelliae]|nr:hypothetical protein CcaCcLH18_12004 [Colletotrichum camelliae]
MSNDTSQPHSMANCDRCEVEHRVDISLLCSGNAKAAKEFIETRFSFSKPLGKDGCDVIAAAARCGRILRDKGDLKTAEDIQRKVLAIYEQCIEEKHDNTISAMTDLATTLRKRGKLEEAITCQKEVLDHARWKFGISHENTLGATFDLARTYIRSGKHADAVVMLCEGATLGREVWGNDSPKAGRFGHELAAALRSCGEYRRALDLIPGVVDNLNRSLGPEDPETLTAMHTMGVLCKDLGLLGKAAASFEDVLRRGEEAFPDGHIRVLQWRSSLAHVRARQGRLEEAIEMHRKVLETMRKQFGDAHPDTLTAMAGLAETLRCKGEMTEAAEWYGLVFDTKGKTFDKDAPEMIHALSDYANSLLDGGETIEAQQKLAEVLGWNEKKFGDKHLHTAMPRNNLAAAYREQGDLDSAEKLLTISFNILDQSPDSSVENTIVVGSNLVYVLFELGVKRRSMDTLTRATELQQALVMVSQSSLSIGHPLTVGVIRNCISMLEALEISEDAQRMKELLATNVSGTSS